MRDRFGGGPSTETVGPTQRANCTGSVALEAGSCYNRMKCLGARAQDGV